MVKFRIGLKVKLLLLSSFLFSLPWFGYQYIWEMEKYLRFGQEQAILGTARALATALHERPNLFNNQASFLPSVEKGKDLYGYQLYRPIRLDGADIDWPNINDRLHYYGAEHALKVTKAQHSPLHFNAMLGKYEKFLYLFFHIADDKVIFRSNNNISITQNDHLQLSLVDKQNNLQQFVISNRQAGWLEAYQLIAGQKYPKPAPIIQGVWSLAPEGYNVEMRIPLAKLGDKIAFAVNDVDQQNGEIITTIGSADPTNIKKLGTILVPSTEIERIVKGMSYTHSSIMVIDKHQRVLAKAGNIYHADGLWNQTVDKPKPTWWQKFEQSYLHPLYYKILSKPPAEFIDKLYDASKVSGAHIRASLTTGKPESSWRLSQDKKAVILSAAYPIFIDNKVHGAVIVEETTNGIRSLRNRALEKLFTAMLAVLSLGALVFMLFASRITNRITRLRNQAENAIDQHGLIVGQITPTKTQDEIGDLSRSFADILTRLSQYNHYLKSMSSRLSHELRTPIAVVKTSLENLAMMPIPEKSQAYIERAQGGIHRLNKMITDMSEATRTEQMLQHTEKTEHDLVAVISSCIAGFEQIYPDFKFKLNASIHSAPALVSPEHIAQLLDKVVNNAVEFSTDNLIEIRLSNKQQKCHIEISNNGALLPEQLQQSLFDSMVSIRSQAQQEQPHLGLGLFIARLICQFHQGNISVYNHHNPDGVTVEISLPLL